MCVCLLKKYLNVQCVGFLKCVTFKRCGVQKVNRSQIVGGFNFNRLIVIVEGAQKHFKILPRVGPHTPDVVQISIIMQWLFRTYFQD
uniref:Uncharacterized protein n=1 Tax=Gasterosteus aculeatus TaxID=69293 RepID=G3N473_GASAC